SGSHGRFEVDLPRGARWIVTKADDKALAALIDGSTAEYPLVILTDDRDRLPTFGRAAYCVEPEEVAELGLPQIEEHWDDSVFRWLDSFLSESVAETKLSELLWMNALRQPGLLHRKHALAVTYAVFECFQPASVLVQGEPPHYCEWIAAE